MQLISPCGRGCAGSMDAGEANAEQLLAHGLKGVPRFFVRARAS